MKPKVKSIFQIPLRIRTVISLFFISVILICPIVSFLFYRGILSDLHLQEETSLKWVSSQNVKLAETRIQDVMNLLQSLAFILSPENITDNSLLDFLDIYAQNYGFYSMGIIDDKGICKTTRGEILDVRNRDYFQISISGETVVTEGSLSENLQESIHIFAVPIRSSDRDPSEGADDSSSGVTHVLTAAYRTGDFLELMNIQSFNGNGGTVIFNSHGEPVSSSGYSLPDSILNIREYLRENPEVLNAADDSEGNRIFSVPSGSSSGNDNSLVCVEPLSVNNWSLISYADENYLKRSREELAENLLLLLLGLYLVIAVISLMYVNVYRKMQRRITDAAFLDPLTRQYNYQYFSLTFPEIKHKEKEFLWLVNFDIDKFRLLNLLHGKETCDKTLKTLIALFAQMYPHDQLYRCHGDVFAAIIKARGKQAVLRKLQLFERRVRQAIICGTIPPFSLSFGVCPIDEFSDLSVIYSNASIARQSAKHTPDEKERFYDDVAREQLRIRNMETAFEEALRNKEFKVYYQPKIDLRTGNICGAEALVRWQKSDGSLIPPILFIPVFEDSGQIMSLDEEVLRIVCRDIRSAKRISLTLGPVSVNLSKRTIGNSDIGNRILSVTRQYSIRPDELSFEITESAADTRSKKDMDSFVRILHELGFTLDMDDYGTGSSTLKSLADTQFDSLKLDKSFIDRIGSEKMDTILISTIRMAERLHMKIVAEGVENEKQVRFLLENGCYIAQGYYFYPPLPRAEYLKHLKAQNNRGLPEATEKGDGK